MRDSWDSRYIEIKVAYVRNQDHFKKHSEHIFQTVVRIIEVLRKESFYKMDGRTLDEMRQTIPFSAGITDNALLQMVEYLVVYASNCVKTVPKIKEDVVYLHTYLRENHILLDGLEPHFIGNILHFYHRNVREIHDEHRDPGKKAQTFDANII